MHNCSTIEVTPIHVVAYHKHKEGKKDHTNNVYWIWNIPHSCHLLLVE